MVNVRNVFVCASMALVAAVSAFPADNHHRTLQAVNFRQDLLDAINAARKKEGMDELCLNEMLMDAAQIQANDMADNNFIKSTGSDGSVPKERAAAQGFKAETVTEIVGAGYRTASSIVAAWSKASSAKSTIFSKSNVMGPGYTFDKTKKYVHFWAVDFSTGECGNGTATGGPAPSGDSSGSVELPSSGSDAPKSSDASGSVEAPESGSGAPAPAGSGAETPAVTPAPAGSGAETPASGSGDPPAATPAPAGSDAETPASGSGDEEPAATPAPAGSGAETPASGSGDPPAAAPAPAGSGAQTPASGSGDEPAATPAPAEEEPETSQ
ncbi:hypothetical protein JG687_00016274 [Phytophthora cactorum]|uniref:SCP domain-containing protein n=1 Tax=Phytophthora cactorum TaxID=29920 RepID=A0A329SFF3_9STRA|nr:hypothetical protein Pcac1_g22311 [Phytophthora cactorum]KAG2813232.1 hypothetical protein PC112_g14820 [Phytophthora cactorum]KAG2814968.1 hypothetical protein PC111_g13751 [Phytophthora cactorum]KAG3207973.1 hypothetical protein PC129_g20993 [Phytophthora cactorum]KAG4225670.1 hypothetical protein PC116_g25909 [Phytophthora cactorum]